MKLFRRSQYLEDKRKLFDEIFNVGERKVWTKARGGMLVTQMTCPATFNPKRDQSYACEQLTNSVKPRPSSPHLGKISSKELRNQIVTD
jgi:hypothetical protein